MTAAALVTVVVQQLLSTQGVVFGRTQVCHVSKHAFKEGFVQRVQAGVEASTAP